MISKLPHNTCYNISILNMYITHFLKILGQSPHISMRYTTYTTAYPLASHCTPRFSCVFMLLHAFFEGNIGDSHFWPTQLCGKKKFFFSTPVVFEHFLYIFHVFNASWQIPAHFHELENKKGCNPPYNLQYQYIIDPSTRLSTHIYIYIYIYIYIVHLAQTRRVFFYFVILPE